MKWPALAYLAIMPPAKLSYLFPPPEAIALSRTLETTGGVVLGAIAIWPLWPKVKALTATFILAGLAAYIAIDIEHTLGFRLARICMELLLACFITEWVLHPPKERRRALGLAYFCLILTAYNALETTICYILASLPTTTDTLTPACARVLGTPLVLFIPAILYVLVIYGAIRYMRTHQ